MEKQSDDRLACIVVSRVTAQLMVEAEKREYEGMMYLADAMDHGIGVVAVVRNMIDENLDCGDDVDPVCQHHYSENWRGL